jgi:hypothetical protein
VLFTRSLVTTATTRTHIGKAVWFLGAPTGVRLQRRQLATFGARGLAVVVG